MIPKMLILTSLAALPAITAIAQKDTATGKKNNPGIPYGLSVGIDAGTCINARPYSNDMPGNVPGKAGAALGVGLYYRFNKHWELGFTAGYKVLNNLTERYIYDETIGQTVLIKRQEYFPVLSTGALVNYHFQVRKLDMYAGVSAGLSALFSNYDRRSWGIAYPQNHDALVYQGIHMGVNYPLSRHWSFNTQLGVERISGVVGYGGLPSLVVPSATVGIRFRF